MKNMQSFFSHFHIYSIWEALIWTIVLSFLYNLVYLFTYSSQLSSRSVYAIQVVLSLLSSIGMYWICTKVWTSQKEKLDFGTLLRVLILQGIYILLVSALLIPLALVAIEQNQMWLMVFMQLVSVFFLIFMIPFQLVYYYALFMGKRSFQEIKTYIFGVFKAHYKVILNMYCAMLLFMMAIDTLSGGTLSLAGGFNVPVIVHSLLYVGNPMFSWMMSLFLAMAANLPLGQMFMILFFLFMIGFLYAYLELNFVAFIQEKCNAYGTKRTQAHR